MDCKSKRRPTRVSKVPLEECLSVLRLYLDRLPQDRKSLPGPSQPIWVEISRHFEGKWNARDVYRECKEDRREIWTKLHPEENINNNDGVDNTMNSSQSSNNCTLNSITEDDDDDNKDWEAPNLDEFEVNISEEFYKKLREDNRINYNGRDYSVLQRWAWTDYIAEEFFKVSESRCAFVFKNAKVYDKENAIHHVTIRGKCKSKRCNNPFYGFLDSVPDTFPVKLRVRCRDTVFDREHEDVRRPVRKVKRARIGQEAAAVGPNNWLKSQLSTLGNQRIPSTIPSAPVIRKCVNEFRDSKLGVEKEDKIDIIKTIENMRYSHDYNNFIRDIKKDKFYVFYGSNAQLHAYKRYHHLMKVKKQKSSIAIDGTGSICKKIPYDNGCTSGHIFLYAIVINFNQCTLSVHQLLTDDQSTILIELWLKNWIRMGAPKPDEVSCDCSRALINALSLAFNEQNIKTYIETLFLNAMNDPSNKMRPQISTYIRLDVAHFIKMISNWKCIKAVENNEIRKFYLFCVALLIDAQTVKEFKTILNNLCIICLNQYNDSILRSGKSVAEIRKDLEKVISNRTFNLNDETSTIIEEDKPKYEEITSEVSMAVKTWINEIRESAGEIDEKGTEINGFYNKTFIDDFFKTIAAEFPLWSAACLPGKQDHATTSYVEAYFNDKKNRVLSNYKNLIRVDKFLKIEYQDHQGGSVILNNHLLNDFQRVEKESNEIETEKEHTIDQVNEAINQDANSYDNWRNKSKKEKNDFDNPIEEEISIKDPKDKKLGFYFQNQPSISFVNNNADSKITTKNMNIMINGNSLRAVLINDTHYSIANSCPFDSIIQILATTAVDDPSYHAFAELSTSKTMKFIMNFIKTSKMDPIYKERARLLVSFFNDKIKSKPSTDVCPLFPRVLDMYSTLVEVWSKCFQGCPSGFDTYSCEDCGRYTTEVSTIWIKYQKKLCEDGYEALKSHLEQMSTNFQTPCLKCEKVCNVNRVFNHHLYVELELRKDLRSELQTCKLSELEKSIRFSANNHQFSLRGIVAHTPGHFRAYCRRSNGKWELHDDVSDKSFSIVNDPIITPSAAIYVRDDVDHRNQRTKRQKINT